MKRGSDITRDSNFRQTNWSDGNVGTNVDEWRTKKNNKCSQHAGKSTVSNELRVSAVSVL